MTKRALKTYLQLYSKIKDALKDRKTEIEIVVYGRKKRFLLEKWSYKLCDYLQEIMKSETNETVIKIIKKTIIEGKEGKSVLRKLPISGSTYYRWRRQCIEKIYELYIEAGDVSRAEILAEKTDE